MLESDITTCLFAVQGNELEAVEITAFIGRLGKVLSDYADLKEENTRLRLEYDNLYRKYYGISIGKAKRAKRARR